MHLLQVARSQVQTTYTKTLHVSQSLPYDTKSERRITADISSTKRIGKEPARQILNNDQGSKGAISTFVSSIFRQTGTQNNTIYTGKSGYGALLNIIEPGTTKLRHITISSAADNNLDEDDLRYLQSKGCFKLPDRSQDLLEAYFKFIHPLFPVVDGPSFLSQYNLHGVEAVNLILLWSMFSVSSSFVPSVCTSEIRKGFHEKACALFHHGGETDKLVLTQTALLLSYWFDDASDVKQSWYWSGIAFSLAQSLGLHDHASATLLNGLTDTAYDLQLDVWHCCEYRDGWLSYSMGRLLRLPRGREQSCKIGGERRFRDMKWRGIEMYNFEEAGILNKIWQHCVAVAQILRQAQSLPAIRQSSQSSVLRDGLPDNETGNTLSISLALRHLRLCEHAATIAVSHMKEDSCDMTKAADDIASIVKLYIDDDSVLTVPPAFVPLLMPAMLVSLSGMESQDKRARNRHESRLQCCLQGLTHAELTYPAATIVKGIFTKAYLYSACENK